MKIKEQAIKDLEVLNPSDILVVYDLILSLKNKKAAKLTATPSAYKRVREALKGCKGSMSDDVLALREDRV